MSLKEFVATNQEVTTVETVPVAAEPIESVKENFKVMHFETPINSLVSVTELKGEDEVSEILWSPFTSFFEYNSLY